MKKDRSGNKEDPIRERKEETADEKARDEGGGYWDEPLEPNERKSKEDLEHTERKGREGLEETDEEFAHRLPVESLGQ